MQQHEKVMLVDDKLEEVSVLPGKNEGGLR